MTSTTVAAAIEAITDHFLAQWGSLTEVGLDNENFKPSSDTATWARVVVRHRVARQDSLGSAGNRKFLRFGAVLVQLFSPIDRGAAPLALLQQSAINVFEGVVLAGTTYRVWFAAASTRETGQDGVWSTALVEAPFSYEEIK